MRYVSDTIVPNFNLKIFVIWGFFLYNKHSFYCPTIDIFAEFILPWIEKKVSNFVESLYNWILGRKYLYDSGDVCIVSALLHSPCLQGPKSKLLRNLLFCCYCKLWCGSLRQKFALAQNVWPAKMFLVLLEVDTR